MNKTVILEVAGMTGRYGIENYIMNMVRNFDYNRIELYFVSYATGPYDEEIKSYGCKLFAMKPYGASVSKILVHYYEFKNLLKNHPEIQVVHIHGNTAIGCLDARIAKKMGVTKVIVHSHSDGCIGMRSFVLHMLGRMICKGRVTHKIACSQAAAKWMFGNTKNCILLKNAICLDKYRFSLDKYNELRKKFGLSEKRIIGHVGRFDKPKNHHFILEVFSHVHKYKEDAYLMLIGDGSLSAEIDQKIKEAHLEEFVIRIKQCDNVNEMLQMMDVFLFPSLREGLGIALIEAQASGLKCIVSEVIKEEACVTDLIEKHLLTEGVEGWSMAISAALEESDASKRSSDEYIEQLRNAGYDVKEAAGVLQNIYMS